MFYGFCIRLCTTFAYIYGFCVRLCIDFAHFVQLMFCASCVSFAYVYKFLCTLSGFCIRILIFVRVERILVSLNSWWSNLEGSLMCWKYRWSNLKGSLISWKSRWSIFRASCSLLLDCLEDPIFMVPLKSLSGYLLAIYRPILPRFFLVNIDRAIYLSRWSNSIVHYAALL